MTTDTRTTNRNYQLPFPSNLLAADVVRLREALTAVDVDVDGLFTELATKLNQAQVQTLVTSAVNGLVAGAPGALDTLQELAAALDNDANFAATVTNALAGLEAEIEAAEAKIAALNTWQVVAANTTAIANSRLFVNTSAGSVTVTLPSAPTTGTYVQIVDAASSFQPNNCIVSGAGNLVMGLAEDLVLDVKNASITLVFSDASTGWRIS